MLCCLVILFKLNAEKGNELQFQTMIQDAIDLLTGKQNSLQVDGDEMRERLLAGYRFILVDEYQDIDDIRPAKLIDILIIITHRQNT
jgi:ATP-dependent exoDNAse (exonuclease V) beta subunit